MSNKPNNSTLTTDEDILDAEYLEEFFQAIEPIPVPADRGNQLRKRILAQVREEKTSDNEKLVTIRANEGFWLGIAPGVKMKILYADKQAKTRSFLLRLQPGASLPAHDHHSDEECMVLEGEANIGELTVSVGDYHLAPKNVSHGILSSKTGALLFLRGDATHSLSWVYNLMRHTFTTTLRPQI